MRVAIVIPALNEAATIARVVGDVRQYGLPVVVDDGSRDDTAALAANAGATVVRHPANAGYDAALASGFARAATLDIDVIVSADADGQLDHRAIPTVIEAIAPDGIDMVLGIRARSARIGEWLINRYVRLRFGVSDILCGMKAFRVEAYRRHSTAMDTGNVYTQLAMTLLRERAGFKTVTVAVFPRDGASRFGGAWRANRRLLAALFRMIRDDATFRRRRRS